MSYIHESNAPYTRLQLEPYSPVIGAYVRGVDLRDLSDAVLRQEFRRALVRHQVLFIRDQTLTPAQQIEFARLFGDPDRVKAYFPRLEGHESVEVVAKTLAGRPNQRRTSTDQWHADITFRLNPPTGTVLYAQDLPPSGGDTLWASATEAYDRLPDGLKPYLETLEATHSFEHSGWPRQFLQAERGDEIYAQARADNPPAVHPVVRVHPITGRKILYVNPNFTDKIIGLPRRQSDALLSFLFHQLERPDVQARLQWQLGTVAVWDNRATLHYAVADYTAPRRLHRVTFGEAQAF